MKQKTCGKMFLADERGMITTPLMRRHATFNFDEFNHPYKSAFDKLYTFNEELLAGGQETMVQVATQSYVIILPITGNINCEDHEGNEFEIAVEELLILPAQAGHLIQLRNPYQAEIVNYLVLCITADNFKQQQPKLCTFNLAEQNKLLKINVGQFPFALCIGCFDGRKEDVYPTKDKNTHFFCTIMNGAFEVQGRLLHQKDGLALWNTEQIEIEALSNNAVIMAIELF